MLLSAGADVNSPAARVSNGLTALQAALMLCSDKFYFDVTQTANKELAKTSILQTLLNAGADVNAPPRHRVAYRLLWQLSKAEN